MPLRRAGRFPAGSGRRPPPPPLLKAARKRPLGRQEWDSTVHDLTVHRATPEDLIRRHEMHKSKNAALVHLELREKTLKNRWKEQRPRASESLEKRKLTLMRQILSDQYQLQDVLERSDQAMAVAKDLFGDAPRRHIGLPNVTVAPDCDMESSKGPIVQKCDPPTQLSILNETVMNPQALNEVEEESFCISRSDSENDQDTSLNFRSITDRGSMLHFLKEENSVVNSQQESTKKQATTTSSQDAHVLATPTAFQSLECAALNATHVVKNIHSRFPNEEQLPDVMYVVQQVLNANPRKRKQMVSKVKRKQAAQTPARQRTTHLSAAATSSDLPNGNKSSLDVLNQMMNDVEREMEAYEQWTGQEIQQTHSSQGVSGFTHSLVNALCRVMRYLKESEMRVRQEKLNRQQLERELSEHRTLIDALTTEVLLGREENLAMQSKLQQFMIVTDEQLTSLTRVLKGLPFTNPGRMRGPAETGELSARSLEATEENTLLNYFESKTNIFRGEKVLELSQADLPCKDLMLPNPPDDTGIGWISSDSTFQPAVLLSPPQQKNIVTSPSLQDESTRGEPAGEQKSSASHRPLMVKEGGTQRDGVPVTAKISPSAPQSDGQPVASASSAVLRQGFAEKLGLGVTMNGDLQGQMAELTLQNSVVKAQLIKFRNCHQETVNSLQQPVKMQNGSVAEEQEAGQVMNSSREFPKSLDERIAELNRQSAEARSKLLLLINQQKLATSISVSPPISPIPSPLAILTENGKKTAEVSIPMAETQDSSKGDVPSPASGTSARRSTGVSSQVFLPQSTSVGTAPLSSNSHRIKAEKQGEEGGWFALSMHVG